MRDPGGLYDLGLEITEVPRGLHLVAGLTGFADAGSAVTQFTEYLLDTLEVQEIATFDADALLDYRARRPVMFFDQDHLTEYKPAKLSLYLAKDELHQPFLLLSGYEPDFQWERFTAAVIELVEKYEVVDTTWVHAIPMPTPHTRPIGVTVSGNRTELIDAYSIWRPSTQLPANALHLLEYRLQELGHPDGRLRPAHPALPGRHRVPPRGGQRTRERQRRHRADLPHRSAPAGQSRVHREGRRSGRGESRASAPCWNP